MNTVSWTEQADGGAFSSVLDDGSVDAKGRRIGHYAEIEPKFEYLSCVSIGVDGEVYGVTGARWSHNDAVFGPARRLGFEVSVYPTRNGGRFGSCSRRGTMVATIEEAKVLAEKKLAAYVRKAARALAVAS